MKCGNEGWTLGLISSEELKLNITSHYSCRTSICYDGAFIVGKLINESHLGKSEWYPRSA